MALRRRSGGGRGAAGGGAQPGPRVSDTQPEKALRSACPPDHARRTRARFTLSSKALATASTRATRGHGPFTCRTLLSLLRPQHDRRATHTLPAIHEAHRAPVGQNARASPPRLDVLRQRHRRAGDRRLHLRFVGDDVFQQRNCRAGREPAEGSGARDVRKSVLAIDRSIWCSARAALRKEGQLSRCTRSRR